MRNFALAIAFTLCASVASAGVTSVDAVQPTVANSPAGYVVNDILIDFDGQLFGQQLVVQLTAGDIYQNDNGGETAPSAAFVGFVPALASDTFVTIGAPLSDNSEPILVVGGTTELGMNAPKQIDTAGINIAWAPGAGTVVDGGVDYLTARVTFSDDAEGAVFYYGNSGTSPVIFPAGNISGGVVSFVPEPTTAVLAVLGMVGFAARRRV